MVSFECKPMYVKDVEDRSNTLKAVMLCMSKMGKEHTETLLSYLLNMVSFECNPMYVEDVEDRSNTPKAVMLCISKMSKKGKEHTETLLSYLS